LFFVVAPHYSHCVCGGATAPPPFCLLVEQIEVQLRGRMNPLFWSPRMLSIAAPRGVAAVFLKDLSGVLCHRCLHVSHAQP
jgi:hypothetical protein